MYTKETVQNVPESLNQSKIYSSLRIRNFLNSVKPGDFLAFFDNDQTITKKGIDTEDLALLTGIIPQEKLAQSGEVFLPTELIDTQALGDPALNGLRKILGMYTTHVTPELSANTGIPVDTVMSSDVLKKVGRLVGEKLIREDLLRENSIDILKAIQKENIRPVILSATPNEIVYGVYEALNNEYKFQSPITIIGTEISFDSQGRASDKLHLFGPPKTEVMRASKAKGAITLFGVGDKPDTSDAFMWECEFPIPINDQRYRGKFGTKSWDKLAAIVNNNQ